MTAIGTSPYYPSAGAYVAREKAAEAASATETVTASGRSSGSSLGGPSDGWTYTPLAGVMGKMLDFKNPLDTPGLKMTWVSELSPEQQAMHARDMAEMRASAHSHETEAEREAAGVKQFYERAQSKQENVASEALKRVEVVIRPQDMIPDLRTDEGE